MSHQNTITIATPLELQLGGVINHCQLEYKLVGKPGAPVILVLGGISANLHVFDESEKTAWWNDIVNFNDSSIKLKNKQEPAIDLNQYQVLSIEYLGGNGQSSGIQNPLSFDKENTILPQDQAKAIHKLIDILGINQFKAVIGNSYGGFVALSFASLFPKQTGQLFVICSAHETPNKAKANRILQRQIIRLTLQQPEKQREGLKIARSLAMLSYRSNEEFDQRFSALPCQTEPKVTFEFERYLDNTSERFSQRFCPYAYLTLSQSIDLFQISPSEIQVPLVTLAFDTDLLIPEQLINQLSQNSQGPSQHYVIKTTFGHDGFLKEPDAINQILKKHLTGELTKQQPISINDYVNNGEPV